MSRQFQGSEPQVQPDSLPPAETTTISELRQSEARLRAAKERYDLAVRGSTDGLWDWDIVTNEVFLSARFKELLGYRDDEMESSFEAWESRLHSEDREQTMRSLKRHLEAQEAYDVEYRLRTRSGEDRWFRARGQALWNEEGRALRMAGSITDITEARRAEERLKRSHEILRVVYEVQLAFLSESVTFFDSLLGHLLQLTDSEYGFIGEVLYRDQGDPFLKTQAITNIAWNEETRKFYERHAPDGMEFYNLKTLFGAVMTSGEPVIANRPEDDARSGGLPPGHPALRAFLGVPLHSQGRLVGMFGIANRPQGYDDELVAELEPVVASCTALMVAHRNEKRRRQAEDDLRRSHEALETRVAERTSSLAAANEELGQYAYLVSHDLKTPLRAIRNYADFLAEDLTGVLQGEVKEYLEGLCQAVGEGETLANDFLELSRVGRAPVRVQPLDLRRFVEDVLSDLKTDAVVQVRAAEYLPSIKTDPNLLRQILNHLLSNAVKFNVSEQKIVEICWQPAGDEDLELSVKDNGMGIDPRFHGRIFQAFKRLHPAGEYEGTGIGLAIVKKAAAALGGTVAVVSEEKQGSTFRLRLPMDLGEPADG